VLRGHYTVVREHKLVLREHCTVVREHKLVLREHCTVVREHKLVLREHCTVVREHKLVPNLEWLSARPSALPIVEATAWTIGRDRQVELIAPATSLTLMPIAATCAPAR
jgi:hypothetical protein